MDPASHNPFMKNTTFHSIYEKTAEEEGLRELLGKIIKYKFIY